MPEDYRAWTERQATDYRQEQQLLDQERFQPKEEISNAQDNDSIHKDQSTEEALSRYHGGQQVRYRDPLHTKDGSSPMEKGG